MFAKIYRQIFDSSLAEDPGARRFFMEMLVLANRNGIVDMTAEAIAGTIKIPLEEVERCIDVLMDIDPNSRSKKRHGARIRYIDSNQRLWGWVIVNHGKYRDCKNTEELRTLNQKGSRKSFVYYIYADPRVKIGCSKNPWERLAEVKKSYPGAKLMAMEPGDRKLMEQRCEEFKDKAIGRDRWFMGGRVVLEHVHDVRRKYGLFDSDGPIKRLRPVPDQPESGRIESAAIASPRADGLVSRSIDLAATASPRAPKASPRSVIASPRRRHAPFGAGRSNVGASKMEDGLTSSPMKLENGVGARSNIGATSEHLNTGLSDTDTDTEEEPPAVPQDGGQLQAEPSDCITDFEEAKGLICKLILNGKDPNRLWSVDASQRLLKHLPIPRSEIERVAWFRTKPNDGSRELEVRKAITETGLMNYWGDEVTRANAYWEKLYGWREKKKAAG